MPEKPNSDVVRREAAIVTDPAGQAPRPGSRRKARCGRTDRIVAEIAERRSTSWLIGNDFYEYTLRFQYPPQEPVGRLRLVVALTG